MTVQSLSEASRLLDGGAALELRLNGTAYRFHALWLRDNAQDGATRGPANGQRLITLLDIPRETRIAAARWNGDRLSLLFQPEDKAIDFDPAWLVAHAYDRPRQPEPGWTADDIVRWNARAAEALPVHDYEAVRADTGARRRWLAAVRRHGFARMRGAPAAEGVAVALAELFGYIRETNYGRAFDVRAEPDARNLAYTSLGLQAHTDNPYRDPVPGLQILAAIRNAATGGDSILIDGFALAERLKAEMPRGFALLAGHCARFAYGGAAGVRLRAKRPIIALGPDGELLAVSFNNRSAAPFTDIPYDDMAAYYAAYRRMAELTEDPAQAFRFRLEPGEVILFDNLRVLHGRTGFTGGGERWLQGCYADRDGLLSTLAALEEDAGS